METALYGPLGDLTVPRSQRHFATRTMLPRYPEQIAALRRRGARERQPQGACNREAETEPAPMPSDDATFPHDSSLSHLFRARPR